MTDESRLTREQRALLQAHVLAPGSEPWQLACAARLIDEDEVRRALGPAP